MSVVVDCKLLPTMPSEEDIALEIYTYGRIVIRNKFEGINMSPEARHRQYSDCVCMSGFMRQDNCMLLGMHLTDCCCARWQCMYCWCSGFSA